MDLIWVLAKRTAAEEYTYETFAGTPTNKFDEAMHFETELGARLWTNHIKDVEPMFIRIEPHSRFE